MEWVLMKRSDVFKQLSRHPRYIKCPKHKTSRIYGSLAKSIAPVTFIAIITYLKMQFKSEDKFLEACNPEFAFPIASYLRKFTKMFLEDFENMTVNGIRKVAHVAMLSITNQERVLKCLQQVDAHGGAVIGKHYCPKSVAQDHILGEAIWEAVTDGNVISWPDAQELKNLKERAQAIINNTAFAAEYIDRDLEREGDGPDFLITQDMLPLDFQPSTTQLALQDCGISSGEDAPAMVPLPAPEITDCDLPLQSLAKRSAAPEPTASASQGSAKKPRFCLSDVQRKYILDSRRKFMTNDEHMPPKSWIIDTFIPNGNEDNVFTDANTLEGIRSFLRSNSTF